MRCVSSRLRIVAPVLFDASSSWDASFSAMLLPPRPRAEPISQRIASDIRRSPLISTGTWYVAPPTRRGFTSMIGVAFRSADSSTSRPGRREAGSSRHRLLLPCRLADLGPVLRAALLAVTHAGGVQRAADDVVLDRREVLHA